MILQITPNRHNLLPFKVEQLAESRSFLEGFRGAWFRCKIKKIGYTDGEMAHALEFYDYPDENVEWTKLYQQYPDISEMEGKPRDKKHIMVRPCFPEVYSKSQEPNVNDISEVSVVVNDQWRVGDLVDWKCDNCFWSATVIEILGNDELMVQLPPPPRGENTSYKAFFYDLRPTLEWSLTDGWRVPIHDGVDGEPCSPCARLIYPASQGIGDSQRTTEVESGPEDSDTETRSWQDGGAQEETVRREEMENTRASKKAKPAAAAAAAAEVVQPGPPELDSLGAEIVELEEMANKLKWLKFVLSTHSLHSTPPSWEFIEHPLPPS